MWFLCFEINIEFLIFMIKRIIIVVDNKKFDVVLNLKVIVNYFVICGKIVKIIKIIEINN